MPPTNLMPAFQLLSIGATFAIQHGRDARATRGRLRAQLTTRIPIFGVDDYSRSFQATMAVPSGDRPRPFPLGARWFIAHLVEKKRFIRQWLGSTDREPATAILRYRQTSAAES